ncbi:Diacylglycerol O-acyltransferase 2 [Diplonema papillatum]|nr:Diacylglycerol O-acyltransferase 2 [Diplonema papillatum]
MSSKASGDKNSIAGSPDAFEDEKLSWLQWCSRLVERMPKGVQEDDKVEVDLDLATCEELEKSIALIKSKLESREAARDPEKQRKQLAHVEAQLDISDKVPLSIQHLELYHAFLGRTIPTDDNKKKHSELTKRIAELQDTHPEKHLPRSGDTEGVTDGVSLVRVPMQRRRQTAVLMFINFFTGPILVMFVLGIFGYIFPTMFIGWLVAYYIWVFYDNQTRPKHGKGSRMNLKYRKSSMFDSFRDYFPMRLAKANSNVTLDKENNYLFCLHPHGVMAASVYSLLAESCGRDILFPGLSMTAQTLPINLWFPVLREHIIAVGAGDASAKAIRLALTWCKGASTVLVVGGAKEALHAAPHENKLALLKRYGFVKLAITTGASLVPCYAFGENTLYDNLTSERPRLVRWQRRVQRVLTFAPLLVSGRGVFSYSGGLIPHRRPLTTVVGDAIPVTKDPSPTKEKIEEVHNKYTAALTELFNLHRDIYDPKCVDIELV